MLRHENFIKSPAPFRKAYTGRNSAPLFRKTFTVDATENAKLYVCGLGYGYYYINGKSVTEDLLSVPVSDYNKTLWYCVYDVSSLLQKGGNVICAELGNGWFNEEIRNVWHLAVWRDNPKFVLSLQIDGTEIVITDTTWKCCSESATYFNQLRSGEYFSAPDYDPAWNTLDYDDSGWETAIHDDNPPTGIFRRVECEPIREDRLYPAQTVTKLADGKYLFDLGQNISGYIRLTVCGEKGDLLTIRYDEEISDLFSIRCRIKDFFLDGEFHTDRFVCSGEPITWSPKFTYHGFRYITIDGIRNIEDVTVAGVFIHQAVPRRTTFRCSDELLNKMYRAGVISSYCNMFHMITDCPTREKQGWANDAQASTEQLLTNFKIENLLKKWLQDIYDAMRADGMLPGIIPTAWWGFDWGNGPVSDGILFEIPMRLYLHKGDKLPLVQSLPYFDRYFAMLDTKRDGNGFVSFGLSDWTNPVSNELTPTEFINAVLIYEFYGIAALAARCAGIDDSGYLLRAEQEKERIRRHYLLENGRCSIEEQTAVAMLIYFDLQTDLEVSKAQLMELIQKENGHHRCGMVGLRRLLLALNKCGLHDVAYHVLTAEGFPGFRTWFELGATTLWETWDIEENHESKNHQMFSDFMSWLIKTLLGIRVDESCIGNVRYVLDPKFVADITFAEGSYETDQGLISVKWHREGETVSLTVDNTSEAPLYYKNSKLPAGVTTLSISVQ